MAQPLQKTFETTAYQPEATPELDDRSDAPMESSGKSHRDPAPLTNCLGKTLESYEDGHEKTWTERIVLALLTRANEGDLRAIQEVWNRIEGKPGSGTATDSAPIDVGHEIARKILEAGRPDDDNDAKDDDETE
jgi:hypothetical protein